MSRRKLYDIALIGSLLGAVSLPLIAASCAGEPEARTAPRDFNQLVYAVRQHTTVEGDEVTIDVAGGMGQVMDYKRYVPGGRLEVLNLDTGDVDNIIAGYATADVASVDVNFDATKVLFSMKTAREDNYHLYVADLTPAGDDYPIRQLTFGPYDDLHGVWLPGGRIAFITDQPYTEMGTRADEYNHARIVTQIGTITLDGGDADRKLCSQNLSHTINLFPLKDGRLGFSRWEHLENINDVKLFAMNPDCTGMVAVAGQHGKPANSLVQVHETPTEHVFVGIATSRENTVQAGALVRIDTRTERGGSRVVGAIDEENAEIRSLTPAVPTGEDPSPVGRYRSPASLPDGRILTSWADGAVNEENELSQTPPDFGVYIYDPQARRNRLIKNHEGSWELYAKPVVKREEPPIIAAIQATSDASVPTRLGSVDVRQTSLGGRVTGAQFDGTPLKEALKATTHVRIIEGFSSEIGGGVSMFGLTMAEGAALLGEAKVEADGSWLADIPPYIPVHLQAIDEFGLAIRNQTLWIQGMPGEDRACGGCHERRTEAFNPSDQALTIAAGRGPEDMVQAVSERLEYPWAYANEADNDNEVQRLLDAKCASCHNETQNGDGPQTFYSVTMTNATSGESTSYQIPRLDLSSRPITVTYDDETKAWPASYVSIFYPAALRMEMNMGATVQGELPPEWGIPSDARGSALVEKLNMWSFRNEERVAWALGEPFSVEGIAGGSRTLHPEDVGVEVTREERLMLIRVFDMGGQFYARQNVEFTPNNNDPIEGREY